jgi:hypothetical protein
VTDISLNGEYRQNCVAVWSREQLQIGRSLNWIYDKSCISCEYSKAKRHERGCANVVQPALGRQIAFAAGIKGARKENRHAAAGKRGTAGDIGGAGPATRHWRRLCDRCGEIDAALAST